jgi:predicted amidophosphoribosyltransferase
MGTRTGVVVRRGPRPSRPTVVSGGVGSVATVLIDRRCVACGGPGDVLCAGCVVTLRPAPVLEAPPDVDTLDALVRYEGVARELVLALKYRNTRPATSRLARALADAVVHHGASVVTFAPTTAVRRRERGYDQAELLARIVARRLRVPCLALLERWPGPAQTGRARAERLNGPVFVARRPPSGSILVVDDVCTTGATLGAAARALRRAGGGPIHAATVAVTPGASATCSLKAATEAVEDGISRWS